MERDRIMTLVLLVNIYIYSHYLVFSYTYIKRILYVAAVIGQYTHH